MPPIPLNTPEPAPHSGSPQPARFYVRFSFSNHSFTSYLFSRTQQILPLTRTPLVVWHILRPLSQHILLPRPLVSIIYRKFELRSFLFSTFSLLCFHLRTELEQEHSIESLLLHGIESLSYKYPLDRTFCDGLCAKERDMPTSSTETLLASQRKCIHT